MFVSSGPAHHFDHLQRDGSGSGCLALSRVDKRLFQRQVGKGDRKCDPDASDSGVCDMDLDRICSTSVLLADRDSLPLRRLQHHRLIGLWSLLLYAAAIKQTARPSERPVPTVHDAALLEDSVGDMQTFLRPGNTASRLQTPHQV